MSKQFKFGIVTDNAPLSALSKEWEYFEVPAAIHGNSLFSDAEWHEFRDMYKKDGRPTPMTSHFFGPGKTGSGASGVYYDRDLIEFAASRTVKRMAELGVKAMGCYGGHFKLQEGFSRTKAIDQAISTVNIIADHCEAYGMDLALEPMADLTTLWPRYLEGIEFAKLTGRKCVKVMADLNYFLKLDQPLEDILKYPEYCLNVHIAGEKGQPNVGLRKDIFVHLFKVLKEAGYEKGVSAASPWVPTNGAKEIDWKYETDKTIKFLQEMRADTYK
ncbi:MAG: sugar phosphate isomerase/epimerase [Treponema sp.]|nr:sugar phosphate isomerase/epimerase [Treponema sp.]